MWGTRISYCPFAVPLMMSSFSPVLRTGGSLCGTSNRANLTSCCKVIETQSLVSPSPPSSIQREVTSLRVPVTVKPASGSGKECRNSIKWKLSLTLSIKQSQSQSQSQSQLQPTYVSYLYSLLLCVLLFPFTMRFASCPRIARSPYRATCNVQQLSFC